MTCPVTVIIEQSISYDPVKLTLKMACALTLLITFSHRLRTEITRDRVVYAGQAGTGRTAPPF